MFGMGPLQLGLCILALALLEVALFWAASSLADVPPLGWGKTVAIALGVAAIWGAINAAVGLSSGIVREPLTPEARPMAFALGALGLAVTWAVPAILYAPLLSVPFSRGMVVSVLQVLLRAFAYVLFAAGVMVVLAIAQVVAT